MNTTTPSHPRLLGVCLPLLVLALGLALTPTAAAQPIGKTIVVPLGSPDPRGAYGTADALEARLAQKRVPVVSLHEARDRFNARSRPPLTTSSTDLDVVAREARDAIEHVAFGRTSAAQKSVREVISRAEKSLESLNRETARARQLLDTCLALVRSQLHANKREEALDQASACRRLVPDLAPSEILHPPNVIGVLAEADDRMRRLHVGKLTVTSAPETSCSVFLNGRHLGTTPFVLDRAAPGEYRVQVECQSGVRGRVHVAQLGDEPVNLMVDSSFDTAVLSDPRLALVYRDQDEVQRYAARHALTLGRDTRADDVILVRIHDGYAELLRFNTQQSRLVARAVVALDLNDHEREAAWTIALAQLAEARIEGSPSVVAARPEPEPTATPVDLAAPVAEMAARPKAPRTPADRHRLRKRTGYALGGVAAALFTTGLALELRAQALQRELVTETSFDVLLEGSKHHQRLTRASWVGVATGPAGLLSAYLTVDSRTDVPWWSYAIGSAGLLLTGVGIYELASANRCQLRGSQGECLVQRDSSTRGALFLSAAVPLLSVPILHWLRRSLHTPLSVNVTPTRSGALFTASLSYGADSP